MKIVYIGGCGHSGSTLLDALLNTHPSIVGLGEVEKIGQKFISEKARCACGERFSECPFWSKLFTKTAAYQVKQVRHIIQTKADYFLGREKYSFKTWANLPVTLAEYMDSTRQVFEYASQQSGASVLVDSTKMVFRAEVLAKEYTDEFVLIHLIRDGRAVAWSYYKKYGKILPFLRLWVAENLKFEMLKLRFAGKKITVSYEAFAANPTKVLRQIARLVEVDEDLFQTTDWTKACHQVNGNMKIFNSNTHIKVDDGWRNNFPIYASVMYYLFLLPIHLYYRFKFYKRGWYY